MSQSTNKNDSVVNTALSVISHLFETRNQINNHNISDEHLKRAGEECEEELYVEFEANTY